jgi:sugar lactone lactonase YvrE
MKRHILALATISLMLGIPASSARAAAPASLPCNGQSIEAKLLEVECCTAGCPPGTTHRARFAIDWALSDDLTRPRPSACLPVILLAEIYAYGSARGPVATGRSKRIVVNSLPYPDAIEFDGCTNRGAPVAVRLTRLMTSRGRTQGVDWGYSNAMNVPDCSCPLPAPACRPCAVAVEFIGFGECNDRCPQGLGRAIKAYYRLKWADPSQRLTADCFPLTYRIGQQFLWGEGGYGSTHYTDTVIVNTPAELDDATKQGALCYDATQVNRSTYLTISRRVLVNRRETWIQCGQSERRTSPDCVPPPPSACVPHPPDLDPPTVAPTPRPAVCHDLKADRVLGQRDFDSMSINETDGRHLFGPTGVVIDRGSPSRPQRLYVWEARQSRILGFSDLRAVEACLGANAGVVTDVQDLCNPADIVLGQPDMNCSGCNRDANMQGGIYKKPASDTLCGMPAHQPSILEGGAQITMAVDARGNLYVPDFWNNRVLMYEAPIASGAKAKYVWGQEDFSGQFPNKGSSYTVYPAPDGTRLHFADRDVDEPFTAGVAVDSEGNLWVADVWNHRVLRFPNCHGVPSKVADLVLGQPNLNEAIAAAGPNPERPFRMRCPVSVRVDEQGNVMVIDSPTGLPNDHTGNPFKGRLLIFKKPYGGFVSGVSPDYASTQHLNRPTGLELEPEARADARFSWLWVNNYSSSQVVRLKIDFGGVGVPPSVSPDKVVLRDYPWDSTPLTGGTVTGDHPDPYRNFFHYHNGGTLPAYWLDKASWGGVGVDRDGNVFVPMLTAEGLNDVWRFKDIPLLPASFDPSNRKAHSADLAIFKGLEPFTQNKVGYKGLLSGMGVAAPSRISGGPGDYRQVVVADLYRLMFWDVLSGGPMGLANGEPADGIAGCPNDGSAFTKGPNEKIFNFIREDHASPQQHLWTTRGRNIEVYDLPLEPWEMPSATITPGPIPLLGMPGQSLILTAPMAVVVSPDPGASYAWVSEKDMNRVFRIRHPLDPVARVVDVILGQPDGGSTLCNRGGLITARSLCAPAGLSLSAAGDLYVSDFALETAGNARLLRFDHAGLAADLSNTTALTNLDASAVYALNGAMDTMGCKKVVRCGREYTFCQPLGTALSSGGEYLVSGLGTYAASPNPVIFVDPLTETEEPDAFLDDFFSMALGLTFDFEGNLFVSDKNRARVLIYCEPLTSGLPPCGGAAEEKDTPTDTPTNTPTSTPTSTPTGTPTSTPTNTPEAQECQVRGPAWTCLFKNPHGIVVDQARGRLYLGDFGPFDGDVARITAFDLSGNCLGSYELGLAGEHPIGLALDAAGDLYVACLYSNRILRVDVSEPSPSAWTHTVALTDPGENPGQFINPRGICFDAAGRLYVAEERRARVQRYVRGPSGSFAFDGFTTDANTGNPFGVVVVGSHLYVTDMAGGEIDRYDMTGATASFVDSSAPTVSFTLPTLLTADAAGNLHLTTGGGSYEAVSTSPWARLCRCTAGGFSYPIGVALDSAGNAYVSDNGNNQIVKMVACRGEGGGALARLAGDVLQSIRNAVPRDMAKQGQEVTPTPTATSTPTVTPTPTVAPFAGVMRSAVAGPNVSVGGKPVRFRVDLVRNAEVRLKLFTLTGETVYSTAAAGHAGMNELVWEVCTRAGQAVASGMYVYRLEADNGWITDHKTGKIVVRR